MRRARFDVTSGDQREREKRRETGSERRETEKEKERERDTTMRNVYTLAGAGTGERRDENKGGRRSPAGKDRERSIDDESRWKATTMTTRSYKRAIATVEPLRRVASRRVAEGWMHRGRCIPSDGDTPLASVGRRAAPRRCRRWQTRCSFPLFLLALARRAIPPAVKCTRIITVKMDRQSPLARTPSSPVRRRATHSLQHFVPVREREKRPPCGAMGLRDHTAPPQ